MSTSLFEKYGGIEAVTQIVHAFYQDVLESPRLAPFFSGYDMKQLIEHQVAFFSQALGGPKNYGGRSLHDAHQALLIDHGSFDEVLQLLHENLKAAGMTTEDIEAVRQALEGLRLDIVDHSSKSNGHE